MSEPTQATVASGNRRKRRKLLLGALALAVLGVAATSFAYYELYSRYYEETEDAYVDGTSRYSFVSSFSISGALGRRIFSASHSIRF